MRYHTSVYVGRDHSVVCLIISPSPSICLLYAGIFQRGHYMICVGTGLAIPIFVLPLPAGPAGRTD